MSKTPFYSVAFFGLMGLWLTATFQLKGAIRYWQEPTIENTEKEELLIVETYIDTLTGEYIYLQKSKDNTPLHYYKKVVGEVCFDKKCRFLDIVVYWNITGRYLGFELPEGEFLSKSDHEPFSGDEYQQLHALLADESLPLDRTTFEELLDPAPKLEEDVDGYSGATSKGLAAMVVKGAAYTTYKLWNIVNGSTMDIVSNLTEQQLTPALLYRILQSRDITDKLWVLERMNTILTLAPQLENILLMIIASDDFYLSYSAIRAINSNHLKSVELKNKLFSIYQEGDNSQKNTILKKLMEAPSLSSEIIISSRNLLPQLNGQQLKILLQLYTKHSISDALTQAAVAKVLKNKNKFISKTAFTFLSEQKIISNNIIDLLDAYKKEKM